MEAKVEHWVTPCESSLLTLSKKRILHHGHRTTVLKYSHNLYDQSSSYKNWVLIIWWKYKFIVWTSHHIFVRLHWKISCTNVNVICINKYARHFQKKQVKGIRVDIRAPTGKASQHFMRYRSQVHSRKKIYAAYSWLLENRLKVRTHINLEYANETRCPWG